MEVNFLKEVCHPKSSQINPNLGSSKARQVIVMHDAESSDSIVLFQSLLDIFKASIFVHVLFHFNDPL